MIVCDLCDIITSDKHDLPRKKWSFGLGEFGIAEGVLWGPGSRQMIHAQCKWSPSVGIQDRVAWVNINAPSAWVLKQCFMIACWDMDGCSSTNWRIVIQSYRVRFLCAFFLIHCAEDFGASFLGFSRCLHGLYDASFSCGLHVSAWGIIWWFHGMGNCWDIQVNDWVNNVIWDHIK